MNHLLSRLSREFPHLIDGPSATTKWARALVLFAFAGLMQRVVFDGYKGVGVVVITVLLVLFFGFSMYRTVGKRTAGMTEVLRSMNSYVGIGGTYPRICYGVPADRPDYQGH
ncbi:MAG TPA: hypothetical protein VLG40_02885 [Candidatus Saccharimonas sp.]|nr:hypothetical protein [Candidatus Saccharimonas sp.]